MKTSQKLIPNFIIFFEYHEIIALSGRNVKPDLTKFFRSLKIP